MKNPVLSLYRYILDTRKRYYLNWLRPQFKSFGTGAFVTKLANLSHPERISIGDNVQLGKQGVLEVFPKFKEDNYPEAEIIIGANAVIGDYFHIGAIQKLQIGQNVLIGRYVLINDHSHGDLADSKNGIPPVDRTLKSKGRITIKDNVWIGDNAAILSGVTIGEGAIVGANSVVTKDVPPYTVVGGVPAQVIKQ